VRSYVAAFAVILVGCHRSHVERPCLAETGCPPFAPVVDCSAADRVFDLADVLAGQAPLGQKTYVRGPLTRGFGACTLRGCREGKCCNRCGAFIELHLPQPCEPVDGGPQVCLDDDAHTIRLEGVGCTGDDSAMCCPFFGLYERTVIARGTLKKEEGPHGWYVLSGASVCDRP
jgi:hypothetical protein